MNPHLVGVLIGAAAVIAAVVIAASIVYRRLDRCRKCWGSGDCPTCQGTFRLAIGICPHCWGGACTSCGGTGVDLEQEPV